MKYRDFLIRPWKESDRHFAAEIIGSVLTEYSLRWEPQNADKLVL